MTYRTLRAVDIKRRQIGPNVISIWNKMQPNHFFKKIVHNCRNKTGTEDVAGTHLHIHAVV